MTLCQGQVQEALWDVCQGSKRVNRAHRPTKDFPQFSNWDLFGPWEKIPEMALSGAGRFFFWLIQTLPTFWATWILIVIYCMIAMVLDFIFQDFPTPNKSGCPVVKQSGFPSVNKSVFLDFQKIQTDGWTGGRSTSGQRFRTLGQHMLGVLESWVQY